MLSGIKGRKTIIFLLFIIFSLTEPVNSMPLPDSYGDNECELVAKDFQKEFGGSLVFIHPLKDNGAYDTGDYSGHFLNAIYIKGNKKIFYIDYQSQTILGSEKEVLDWYEMMMGKKAEIWNLAHERPPFPIIWHY